MTIYRNESTNWTAHALNLLFQLNMSGSVTLYPTCPQHVVALLELVVVGISYQLFRCLRRQRRQDHIASSYDWFRGYRTRSGGAHGIEGGRAGEVTSAEFDLFGAFFETPRQVLTREALVENVLDRKFSPFDRSIDLHISNLRRKLAPQNDGAERIRSVRGIGYLYAWPMQD
jgi:hypothetical protein